VVAAIVCYLPALRDGFALDDTIIIRDNLRIHSLRTLPQALGLPYWYDEGHLYRPLTTLSFGLEWLLGGGGPFLFHAINVLWHALVSALVVRVALRWWPPVAAAVAGVWFALHPVHAEAVANIVGRSELACAGALLGIVLVASRAPATSLPADRRRQWWTIFGLAAVAMASKEIGAVAPIIAWAAALTPCDPRRSQSAESVSSLSLVDRFNTGGPVAKRPVADLTLAALAGVAVLLAARVIVLGSFAGDEPHYAFTLVHGVQASLLALATLPIAGGLAILPRIPRLDYSPPESLIYHPSLLLAAAGAALVLAAVSLVILHAWRPSRSTMAACFAIAVYAPVSNLLVHTGVIVADRTLYSASIGVALLVGGVVAAVPAATRWIAATGMLLVAATGAVITVESLGAWHDSRSAFAAIRDRSPSSYIGHYMVAKVDDIDGNARAAHDEYQRAVALTPHNPALLYMAGANDLRLRDTAAALDLFNRAVALGPMRERTRTALATLTLIRGDTVGAVRILTDGLALDSTQRTWRDLIRRIEGRR